MLYIELFSAGIQNQASATSEQCTVELFSAGIVNQASATSEHCTVAWGMIQI
jgi:hypothetical protein